MAERRRVNLKGILADENLRRELMVPTIQALQAREGIDTSLEQAERAYYVVNEAEKSAFFDLDRYKGSKKVDTDRREEFFVRALRGETEDIRVDVARRDFASIALAPIAYRRVGLVAHLFRENVSFAERTIAIEQGVASINIDRYVRYWWEIQPGSVAATHGDRAISRPWARFAKGGSYSRFYSDIYLLMFVERDWEAMRHEVNQRYPYLKGNASLVIHPDNHYFSQGFTWPLRTQRGFNVRYLPSGCVFGHKGPAGFVASEVDLWFLIGILNSAIVEYILQGLTSFGSWEIGAVRRLPCAAATPTSCVQVSNLSRRIHDTKADWDTGNETSTRFTRPWLLLEEIGPLDLPARLDYLAEQEANEEGRIQALYAELNDEAYKLYGISAAHRAEIEATMGDRPPEVLWVAMERKDAAQKRMEHVSRLLSYAIKRVLEADDDGIVPFQAVAGEPALIDRLRSELHQLFPQQDPNALEVALTNELKRRAKGYRSVASLEEWLNDVFYVHHDSLYKSRPILWHIASSQGSGACGFGALVRYHTFDYERLAKLRGTHLRDAIAHFRREAGLAGQEGRTDDRLLWQGRQEEAELLDQKLQWIQEGINGHPAAGDCRIRTPWKAEVDQPQGWRPDLDDGVVVNIAPLQVAGVLRTPGGPS